eukprot:1689483-Amphidinium_carterae.1
MPTRYQNASVHDTRFAIKMPNSMRIYCSLTCAELCSRHSVLLQEAHHTRVHYRDLSSACLCTHELVNSLCGQAVMSVPEGNHATRESTIDAEVPRDSRAAMRNSVST